VKTILNGVIASVAVGCLSATPLHAARPAPAPRISTSTQSGAPPAASVHRALLDRYCVTCHNEKLRTGGLALDTIDVANVAEGADVWEKVVRKLRAGVMPPSGRPRPDKPAYDGFAAWLEDALDRAAAGKPHPGRPPAFHRLNRTEYHNAIRDLLGLDVDVASVLPADDSSFGFDNIGDVLGVTPALLEGYLEAARKVSQEAVGDPAIAQDTDTYRIAPDLTQDYRLEGLPFGTRGGTLVRHNFPVDGEYVIAVQLLRSFIGGIMGLAEQHELEMTLDGERLQLFTIGGKKPRAGDGEEANQGAQASRNSGLPEDAGLRVRVAVKAGPRSVGVTFLQRSSAQVEDLRPPYLRSFAVLSDFANGQPHIANVAISGPFGAAVRDTPSRQRVFACRPARGSQEAACAKKILSGLARLAYRRPITETDLQPLLEFYETGRRAGGFEAGIQKGLQRLLVSPAFLVRIERDPVNNAPDTNYRISDFELASRLSFFLWSSLPDNELLDLAEHGRLGKPVVLAQQVQRMLADDRSRALVGNFGGQWLYLRNVPAARPDTQLFPDFDENLRLAFRRETELLFETIVHEDRSALDLIGARYTYVDERLARHYGIPNVYGSHFRRIALSDDSVRGGLLGQGSILTVTSYPNRTSPVQRGKWILENILGSAPPPPPPNVPALEEKAADGKVLSMRERMVQHRANPVCATCHSRMDPVGLSLENFDAVGRWRDTGESSTAIDASGALPDGTPFNGPRELRAVLLNHPETFISTLTEKLLTYAVGRGLEYYDRPAVRAIAREAAGSDYRFSALILGIVKSPPFQMRRSRSA
jgi:hypothetical protein